MIRQGLELLPAASFETAEAEREEEVEGGGKEEVEGVGKEEEGAAATTGGILSRESAASVKPSTGTSPSATMTARSSCVYPRTVGSVAAASKRHTATVMASRWVSVTEGIVDDGN